MDSTEVCPLLRISLKRHYPLTPKRTSSIIFHAFARSPCLCLCVSISETIFQIFWANFRSAKQRNDKSLERNPKCPDSTKIHLCHFLFFSFVCLFLSFLLSFFLSFSLFLSFFRKRVDGELRSIYVQTLFTFLKKIIKRIN